VASILLVMKHYEQERKQAEDMVRIAMETATTPMTNEQPIATAGGDERKLRGIPAIGRGVPGAIANTKPGHGGIFR
jgi:hypothetical protein